MQLQVSLKIITTGGIGTPFLKVVFALLGYFSGNEKFFSNYIVLNFWGKYLSTMKCPAAELSQKTVNNSNSCFCFLDNRTPFLPPLFFSKADTNVTVFQHPLQLPLM